jgi:hypothetical protein
MENNPHNSGHGWVGSWMGACQFSPADPVFWVFHCELDRLWAKWQWRQNKFSTAGTDATVYTPLNQFADGSTIPLGHYLKDAMWPWDGTMTPADEVIATPKRRPGEKGEDFFPKSKFPGLWPPTNANPRPLDMIDYLGLSAGNAPHGFCYADVPYGQAGSGGLAVMAPAAVPVVRAGLLRVMADGKAPAKDRSDALMAVTVDAAPIPEAEIAAVARDADAPVELRTQALHHLSEARAALALPVAIDGAQDKTPAVRLASARAIAHSLHFPPEGTAPAPEAEKTLERMLDDSDPNVRRQTVSALAGRKNPAVVRKIDDWLARAAPPAALDLPFLVRAAAAAGSKTSRPAMRKLLHHAEPKVAAAAVFGLAGDSDSLAERMALLRDRATPVEVREAIVEAIMCDANAAEFGPLAVSIALDSAEPVSLRAKAVAGFRVASEEGIVTADLIRSSIDSLGALLTGDVDSRLRRSVEVNLRWIKEIK